MKYAANQGCASAAQNVHLLRVQFPDGLLSVLQAAQLPGSRHEARRDKRAVGDTAGLYRRQLLAHEHPRRHAAQHLRHIRRSQVRWQTPADIRVFKTCLLRRSHAKVPNLRGRKVDLMAEAFDQGPIEFPGVRSDWRYICANCPINK